MTKYKNTKIEFNGLKFDSKKEYNRYLYLKSLQENGDISGLECQKPYVLIESKKLSNGKTERGIKYIADFFYLDGLTPVIEDVKGFKKGSAYAIFTIKRKLMLKEHGIEIREI